MDHDRFDRLSHLISRRQGLGLLATLGLTGLTTAQTSAKKNKNKNKNKNKRRCRVGSGKQRCGGKCYPKCPKSGQIRDNTCTCRCLALDRKCIDGSCVPEDTCCAGLLELECPSDPSGCCKVFAGEECSTNEGCCDVLNGELPCPGDGSCCDLDSGLCCCAAGCVPPDPVAGCCPNG